MSEKQLGKAIKQAREKAGLTQEALAQNVGVHVSYLSRLERGVEKNPTKEVLEGIGRILKMKASDLLAL